MEALVDLFAALEQKRRHRRVFKLIKRVMATSRSTLVDYRLISVIRVHMGILLSPSQSSEATLPVPRENVILLLRRAEVNHLGVGVADA